MFVIIGPTSCKTYSIRKILNLTQSTTKTTDIKCYKINKKNIIIDTPDIKLYKNYYELLEKCQKFSFQKITNVILFYTNIIKFIEIQKLDQQLKLQKIKFYIYDNQNIWQYTNTNLLIINFEQMKKLIIQNPIIKTSSSIDLNFNIKKYIIIGETNVGKSTFINYILNNDIIKTENKKYTTKETLMVQTKINNNIVNIYDTYGLETQTKQKIYAINKLIEEADRIIIIMDINNYQSKFNRYIIKQILKKEKNISIIITKLDTINDKIYYQEKIISYFITLNIQPFFSSINIKTLLPNNIFQQIYYLKQIKVSKKILTQYLSNKIKNLVYAKLIYSEDEKYNTEILTKTTNQNIKININKIHKQIIKKYNLYNFYNKFTWKKTK